MNSEDTTSNLQRLIDGHPQLFRGQAPACSSYVCDGWYHLVDKLCTDIEAVLGPEACAEFECRQVKEKFGTLRFYYRLNDSEDLHIDLLGPDGRQHLVAQSGKGAGDEAVQRVRELVHAACAASENICEECGEPAQLLNLSGYYTTLCETHKAEFLARRSRT